ncbi:carbohydrate ABC transporter permease [Paenibacillus glycinis]|uniref:ABC transporter permease subunit n=1 Tax=Paenibacillus glycinis TaxID=2697035 RepID=A0ABW9XKD6_9BACL|nr:sugar ABC transporter permease [Paenibacillus glycinis]NBD22976.1 ABC transporter permease subunit [Paenibacillus glycinis]
MEQTKETSLPRKPIFAKKRASKFARKQAWTGFAYAAPALLLLLVFRFWPMAFGAWISLWKWGFVPDKFIGFGNFAKIFEEGLLYKDALLGWQFGPIANSLMVTVYYAIGTIPISIFLSFLLAYFLFQKIKGKGILRTVFFIPYITSQVAAGLVFKWIFHTNVGVANAALKSVGLQPQDWLSDPDPLFVHVAAAFGGTWPSSIPTALAGPSYALIVIMLFTIWSSIGFNIVIFLAGMGSVSPELYEAARIDGAGTARIMRHVTWPLLSPMVFLLSIISVIGSFESFNAFYIISGGEGGPLGTTMSLPLYIFRTFYVYGQVGYASAISMFLFAIILLLTWVQYKYGEKRVHYLR